MYAKFVNSLPVDPYAFIHLAKIFFMNLYGEIWEAMFEVYPIYQPLRSGRIWQKVKF